MIGRERFGGGGREENVRAVIGGACLGEKSKIKKNKSSPYRLVSTGRARETPGIGSTRTARESEGGRGVGVREGGRGGRTGRKECLEE